MITQKKKWKEISPAGVCWRPSTEYLTGDWRTYKPIRDTEKCTRCSLCVIYCPDGAIHWNNKKEDIEFYTSIYEESKEVTRKFLNMSPSQQHAMLEHGSIQVLADDKQKASKVKAMEETVSDFIGTFGEEKIKKIILKD